MKRLSGGLGRYLNIIIYVVIVSILAINAITLFVDKRGHEEVESGELTTEQRAESPESEFSTFDPNTATFRELLEAGLPRNIAVSIVRWRESGKIYRIKEDLALCYGMSDSLYFAIEPYIIIGEEFRFKPKSSYDNKESHTSNEPKRRMLGVELKPFSLDTVGLRYLTLLGFSTKEAELIIRYREIIGGYRNFEKFDECYAVDSTMAERLRPYIIFTTETVDTLKIEEDNRMIEINSADSATLCRVRGIGPKSAREIIIYRKLLGGYYSVEQISELSVVLDKNFEEILPQIYCDSAEIKKININFAASNELETHPYITSRMLRKIINKRVLKGGWSTIQEMIDDDIFTSEEAMRIAPYLDFGTDSE